MVPLMVVCFYIPISGFERVAAAIFVLAYITDILDGYIARRYDLVSDFGKLMDPIADKLLTCAALIMMTGNGMVDPLATLIIIAREFAVSGIRLVAATRKNVIAASKLGKLKTVVQCIAITGILLNIPGLEVVCQVILWISVAITVISFIDYAVSFARSGKEESK